MKKQKKPVRTSAQLEFTFIGEEPTWDNKKTTLVNALNWYANQLGPKDSKKFTLEYIKTNKFDKNLIKSVSEIDDIKFSNIGFVCRMMSRGAPIEKEQWVKDKLNLLIEEFNSPKKVSALSQQTINSPTKQITIQDRIFDQTSEYIGDIDEFVDVFIKTKKLPKFDCYDYLIKKQVKPQHTKQIKDYFKKTYDELYSVINTTDEELIEGYSSYKKTELNNYFKFISSIIEDCDKLSHNIKIRKPRKKKVISVDKKVSKLQYKKEDKDFKIASVDPTKIIGATQLWVFNTKYKKLGVYYSNDESGFSVKGTSIQDFNEQISVTKTLRKPLDILPIVTKGKKTELKKLMSTINSKESLLNGRINSETILLKVT